MTDSRTEPLEVSPYRNRMLWALLGAVLLLFYAVLKPVGGDQSGITIVQWLVSTWTPENNYEHGWLVVGLTGWLIWRGMPAFRAAPVRPSAAGLILIAAGILLFLAGCRTLQPRVCVVAVPFLALGSLLFVYGWERARHMVFPLSMVAFVIPMPGFQQATTGLQIMATQMAHHASNFLGMGMGISGNRVFDPTGNLGNWEIDEGCSGIRSLVALTLVTYVYGMMMHRKWSERLIIFAACIPIAILSNAVRVTSILVVARVNVDFARTTWHDYSGFMSFGAALALLMLLSTVMRHGLRALRPKVKVTRIQSPPPGSGGGSGGAAVATDPF